MGNLDWFVIICGFVLAPLLFLVFFGGSYLMFKEHDDFMKEHEEWKRKNLRGHSDD